MKLHKKIILNSYAAVASLFFERSIWSVYLVQRGFTVVEIGLLQTLLSIAMFIFETPSGILADKFGARLTLYLGHILNATYLLLMLILPNFSSVVVAFIAYGIGFAMISGSDQTLVYNYDNGDDYSKKIGIYNGIAIVSLAFSSFLGGILSDISWAYVFLLGITTQVISMIILSGLSSTDKKDLLEEPLKFIDIFRAFRTVLSNNRSVRYLLLSIIIFQSILSVLYNFVQLLFLEKRFSNLDISIILSIGLLFSAVSSLIMDYLNKKIGKKFLLSLFLLTLLLVGLIFMVDNIYWLSFSFLVFVFSYEFIDTTLNTVLHNHLNDKSRTFFVSFVNTLTSLLMIISNFIFTFSIKFLEVEVVFMGGTILCVISTILFLIKYYNIKNVC